MMEKLKYTKFKTLLISSFICISIIPVVLLGLFIFHLSTNHESLSQPIMKIGY